MEGMSPKRKRFSDVLKGGIEVPPALPPAGSRNALLRESLQIDQEKGKEESEEKE